jgi:hypothetical protein
MLPPRKRARLIRILAGRQARAPAVLREAVALIEESGALQVCHAEAVRLMTREWRRLSRLLRPSRAKIMLRALCAQLLRMK